MQKAKEFSDEALQIAEKRREAKKRKGKIYQLNAEFQRIARSDQKAFLSDQFKEIEGERQEKDQLGDWD